MSIDASLGVVETRLVVEKTSFAIRRTGAGAISCVLLCGRELAPSAEGTMDGWRPRNTSEVVTASSTAKRTVYTLFRLAPAIVVNALVFTPSAFFLAPYFRVGNPYSPVSRQYQCFRVRPSTTTSKYRRHTYASQYLWYIYCLLYTSPSPRDLSTSRMPSSA